MDGDSRVRMEIHERECGFKNSKSFGDLRYQPSVRLFNEPPPSTLDLSEFSVSSLHPCAYLLGTNEKEGRQAEIVHEPSEATTSAAFNKSSSSFSFAVARAYSASSHNKVKAGGEEDEDLKASLLAEAQAEAARC